MTIHIQENYLKKKTQLENFTFSKMTFREISRLNSTVSLSFDIIQLLTIEAFEMM